MTKPKENLERVPENWRLWLAQRDAQRCVRFQTATMAQVGLRPADTCHHTKAEHVWGEMKAIVYESIVEAAVERVERYRD